MQPHVRFQIVETIAQGDFATVYKAVDNELGREVAIKQIHQQYLADPTKLERYWQEAQLLANTEHPYVMTIYDIVRERGWLVLELMQGNLKQKLDGNPIDLEDLRLTLTYMLHALHFLEQNGIVHGDIKPSNLLLDKNHRVKLGDFGIARRLVNDDGSVIKGTTKYMAPEVVSDQFGPVGPHSDLYSLGFSAYELMAGNHFDTLFPSLHMFGRDPQMAWIMWHSAGDQRLPEINRVLQGVPEDLAMVIQKLVEKNPANRYPNAEKALLELRAGVEGGGETLTAEERAELEAEEKQAKRRRGMLIGVLCMSVCMSFLMLFSDMLFKEEKPPPKPPPPLPTTGIITDVFLDHQLIEVDPGAGGKAFAITFDEGVDKIIVNGQVVTLADLQTGDRVDVARMKSQDGKEIEEITAERQTGSTNQSTIASLTANDSIITLAQKDPEGKPVAIYIPTSLTITFNGSEEIDGRSVQLADLKPDDRVVVDHVPGDRLPLATSLAALRVVSASGVLVKVDANQRTVFFKDDRLPGAAPKQFQVAEQCTFSLNGAAKLSNGQAVTLGDLKANDSIQMKHDEVVVRIDAERKFSHSGTVSGVDVANSKITVRIANPARSVDFSLAADCAVKLSPSEMDIPLSFIEPGDNVTLAHTSATLQSPETDWISVIAQSKPVRWAVVIGQQTYDDNRIAPLEHTQADAEHVRDTLQTYYRVSPSQVRFELDATRPKLEQGLPGFLQSIPLSSQLIVYFGGHGFLDEQRNAVLATKEFRPDKAAATGLSLGWLVSQLEQCSANEVMLLIDSCHNASAQPATSDLVATLQDGPTRPVSRSVHIVASCSANERGLILRKGKQGVFATAVSDAMRGAADADGDRSVNIGELYTYLQTRMSELSAESSGKQTPIRFVPDLNPPRLLAETKTAVLGLLRFMDESRFDNAIVTLYDQSKGLQTNQPDVALAYGLVMLKHNRTKESQDIFEQVRAAFPEELLPYHALAWQYFMQKNASKAMGELNELAVRLPDPDEEKGYAAYEQHLLDMMGRMGWYAFQAAEPSVEYEVVKSFNDIVSNRGVDARTIFLKGVAHVRGEVAKIDEAIDEESNDEKLAALQRERRRVGYYVDFGFDLVVDYLEARLEQ